MQSVSRTFCLKLRSTNAWQSFARAFWTLFSAPRIWAGVDFLLRVTVRYFA